MESPNNITLRSRKNLHKSKSYESLDINTSYCTTDSEIIQKSLDLSTNNIDLDLINELQQKNDELASNLYSTQNELENIILENIELKKQIEDLNKQIISLKNICRTPSSAKKDIYSRKKALNKTTKSTGKNNAGSVFTQTDNLEPKENYLKEPAKDSILQNPDIPPIEKKTKKTCQKSNNILESQKSNSTCTNQSDKTLHQKTIYIAGGDQCSGLAEKLMYSRKNSPYTKYLVTSFIKPGADTDEILNTCKTFEAKSDDRIIISVGENDTDPNKIIFELSNFLKQNKNRCPILVLSVQRNSSLNEYKLNQSIKMICNYYKENCYFVNCNLLLYHNYVCKICTNVNRILDQIDYETRFLGFMKKYNKGTLRSTRERICYAEKKSVSKPKKSRITDYFQVKKTTMIGSNRPVSKIVQSKITAYYPLITQKSQTVNNNNSQLNNIINNPSTSGMFFRT